MAASPQAVAEKWSRNLGASSTSIQEGVNAVTVAPTARAAERSQAYLQGVQAAVSSGKLAAGLRRVSLEDWKRAMLGKGVPRIASGANAAVSKMADFMAEFLPYLDSGVRALDSIPRGDLQTNIARAVRMIEHNAQFRRRS